jgi:hypothetical protein
VFKNSILKFGFFRDTILRKKNLNGQNAVAKILKKDFQDKDFLILNNPFLANQRPIA